MHLETVGLHHIHIVIVWLTLELTFRRNLKTRTCIFYRGKSVVHRIQTVQGQKSTTENCMWKCRLLDRESLTGKNTNEHYQKTEDIISMWWLQIPLRASTVCWKDLEVFTPAVHPRAIDGSAGPAACTCLHFAHDRHHHVLILLHKLGNSEIVTTTRGH